MDKVNEKTVDGMSLMDAIQETWTFTRAFRWGFSKVTVVGIAGTPGHYTMIDVLLEKAEDQP